MPNTAASRLVLEPFSEPAVVQAAHAALEEVGGKASLGFVFASADYKPMLPDFLELVQLHAHIPLMIGGSSSGLIGVDREAEESTGFSLLLLHLPETQFHVCHLTPEQVEEAESDEDWHRLTGVQPGEVDAWIAVADPYGFPVEPWLNDWHEAYPGVPVIGGLVSSGSAQAEDVFVFHNREALPPSGLVLVGLKGGVTVRPLLSQGCRPIGEPLTVTGANNNLVLGLGGKPAYAALAEAFESLSDADKAHAQGNLFAGLASSEYLEDFKQGDFLIRTILGADANTGAVALGAFPRVGQTLQWQLRDRESAEADLQEHLAELQKQTPPPFASLVFACTGRGVDLFGGPGHDAHALAQSFGPIPSAGLFCNGEIGPVAGHNFVHGYTLSAALFA
jgi:small ligand-binding sensory domain FIST